MSFLDNIKVSSKLGILITGALLALTLIGYTGYYYLDKANADIQTIYKERLIPVKLLNESSMLVERANGATLEMMLTTDIGKNQELKKMIEATVVKSNVNLAEVEKAHMDAQGKDLFDKMQASKQKFREKRQVVLELAFQNKNAEAYAIYVTEVYPLATDFIKKLSDLSMHYAALSEQMNKDSQAAFDLAVRKMLITFAAAFVLLGFTGFCISRMITRPLATMVTVCGEFAAGDFRDKPRRLIRKDELGQLADAMAAMRGNLRNLFRQVDVSVEQVAASSEQLTASADQSAQAASQVAGSITEVAKGMEAQLTAANDTTAVVQQMSAAIQQIAANASEVAGKSAQAADKATHGNQSVYQAVNQMANVEQAVAASAMVVTQLGERSQEIGQIVDTISGIASQTNLLALNAAIEAARAGEQGRGFAVVAEEVRKLAEQSQEAAKQIASLINEIQGDTNKAVEAMRHGTQEVKTGTEVVNTSGQAFQEIAELITQVSFQIKGISTAIEQMAAGSQQLVGSVKQIDDLSKKVSGEAQTVSAATQEQSASMEEIASSSQELAKLALDLRVAVSKFQM